MNQPTFARGDVVRLQAAWSFQKSKGVVECVLIIYTELILVGVFAPVVAFPQYYKLDGARRDDVRAKYQRWYCTVRNEAFFYT
jgi:hypothetical protein